MSPTLSPLSPITQVRGRSGVGDGPVLSGRPPTPSREALETAQHFWLFVNFFKHMGNALISGLESPVPSWAGPTLAFVV